ncbi:MULTISPECIES: hypothetical protein [unclassified Streptomyces]|uniref:hypothetical protein n=1 Tax=unclassified Streptomyces TaxID=2593676 RepID=UPI000372CCAB|nr:MULTISPECIES: hypothetical protein [unclassified Streptomyces]
MVSKRRSLRTAVVGVLGAASLALAGTATAATAAPAAASGVVAQKSVAATAGITATPSATSVRAWELFRVTGRTTGLKAGSKVTLQQKQHGTWVSLPASMNTSRTGSYSLGVKLGLKGRNDLRIVSGTTASPVFQVTVR